MHVIVKKSVAQEITPQTDSKYAKNRSSKKGHEISLKWKMTSRTIV